MGLRAPARGPPVKKTLSCYKVFFYLRSHQVLKQEALVCHATINFMMNKPLTPGQSYNEMLEDIHTSIIKLQQEFLTLSQNIQKSKVTSEAVNASLIALSRSQYAILDAVDAVSRDIYEANY